MIPPTTFLVSVSSNNTLIFSSPDCPFPDCSPYFQQSTHLQTNTDLPTAKNAALHPYLLSINISPLINSFCSETWCFSSFKIVKLSAETFKPSQFLRNSRYWLLFSKLINFLFQVRWNIHSCQILFETISVFCYMFCISIHVNSDKSVRSRNECTESFLSSPA